MANEFSDYVKAAKGAQKAKADGAGIGAVRQGFIADENGNVIKKEKPRKVQLQPATTEEVFGTGKMQKKKKEVNAIPSETKINNADHTKDWMSVGDMLSK